MQLLLGYIGLLNAVFLAPALPILVSAFSCCLTLAVHIFETYRYFDMRWLLWILFQFIIRHRGIVPTYFDVGTSPCSTTWAWTT
jgi:uncharacterized metal-binding protein